MIDTRSRYTRRRRFRGGCPLVRGGAGPSSSAGRVINMTTREPVIATPVSVVDPRHGMVTEEKLQTDTQGGFVVASLSERDLDVSRPGDLRGRRVHRDGAPRGGDRRNGSQSLRHDHVVGLGPGLHPSPHGAADGRHSLRGPHLLRGQPVRTLRERSSAKAPVSGYSSPRTSSGSRRSSRPRSAFR